MLRRPVVVRRRPGLLGTMARTAVVAGTATTATGSVTAGPNRQLARRTRPPGGRATHQARAAGGAAALSTQQIAGASRQAQLAAQQQTARAHRPRARAGRTARPPRGGSDAAAQAARRPEGGGRADRRRVHGGQGKAAGRLMTVPGNSSLGVGAAARRSHAESRAAPAPARRPAGAGPHAALDRRGPDRPARGGAGGWRRWWRGSPAAELLDTDRYVATVAPLASDPQVQAAIIDRVTDEIMARLPIEQLTTDLAGTIGVPNPERITDLATPAISSWLQRPGAQRGHRAGHLARVRHRVAGRSTGPRTRAWTRC